MNEQKFVACMHPVNLNKLFHFWCETKSIRFCLFYYEYRFGVL